jgi:integrase
MRPDNPASGFRRRIETERERFLTLDEIARLAKALTVAKDQRAAGIVRLCMLTGARLGEVQTARFEQFKLSMPMTDLLPPLLDEALARGTPPSPRVALSLAA